MADLFSGSFFTNNSNNSNNSNAPVITGSTGFSSGTQKGVVSPNAYKTPISDGSNIPVTKDTKEKKQTDTTSTTNTNVNTNKNTNTVQDQNQIRDLQNVTDPVLRAINEAVANLANNSTLQATDQGRQDNIAAILNAIKGFDAGAIQRGAEGNVSQLSRELFEKVLPQFSQAVEASGTSNNALGALLAQDAASRTGEAQARVREQARSNAQQEFINMIQAATGATAGGSAIQDSLTNLINASKGTVDQGSVNTKTDTGITEVGSSSGTENRVGSSTELGQSQVSDAAVADALNSNDTNSQATLLALLQSSLSPFQSIQELGYNPTATSDSGINQSNRDSADSIRRLAQLLGIY